MMLMIRAVIVAVLLSARVSDLASARTRSAATGAWMLLGAASLYIALPGLAPMLEGAAHAGINRIRRFITPNTRSTQTDLSA
jgi:ABC-type amino acid transport system permease subunit